MSADGVLGGLICLVLGMGITLFLGISADVYEISKEYRVAKELCEVNLPRSAECYMVFLASKQEYTGKIRGN